MKSVVLRAVAAALLVAAAGCTTTAIDPRQPATATAGAATATGNAAGTSHAPIAITPAPDATSFDDLTPDARAQSLDRFYAAYWEALLQLQPVRATSLGDVRYNDRLPDFFAADFREAAAAFDRAWLARLRAIGSEGLRAQSLLSYRIFEADLEASIERERFPSWMLPLDQLSNIAVSFAEMGAGKDSQPFASVKDHDDWIARARRIPRLFATMRDNMRTGMRQGVVQPQVLMHKVLPQLDAVIAARAEDTPFWQPIANLPAHVAAQLTSVDRARLEKRYRKLIERELMPAYRALRAFVADEYLPASRSTVGMSELPDGAAWYRYRIRMSTSLDLDPDAVHAQGLREVPRIRAQMESLKRRVGFKGTLDEFFAFVRDDDRFAFKSERQMLDAFRTLEARVARRIPRLFDAMPKAPFAIRPVEAARAASDAAGSYRQPAPDGRPGIFFVNTHDLPSRRTWDTENLFLHEAIPGHHVQIALAQELSQLPAFRRYGGEAVFEEGWALYAESLGKELGLYADPYQEFGRLQAQLWRAIRLVVDTGLHAKGWTRDEVIGYMKEQSAVSDAEAQSETDRYIANPGQALAYKIGEAKIHELRARARRALGTAFNVREFHAKVLSDGALPLPLLEDKIDRFIAAKRLTVARAGFGKTRAR